MKKFTFKLWAVLLLMLVSLQTFATDNKYGLKDNIQDGVILHCFDWTYEQIKEELPNIAAAGFSAVQTSPAHPREPVGAAWYMLYQPRHRHGRFCSVRYTSTRLRHCSTYRDFRPNTPTYS